MINKNNNLNLLLTKMAYGVYDTYSVDERWLDGGPPWGKTKKQVAEDTKRFADEAKAQDLNLTFSSHRYGEGSMSPDEAIAKILKAKTKKDLMGYDKDLPYFYTLATQEPGFFNFLSERKPLDYDNHPLYKESSIKVANNLMSLVVNKQAAKSAGFGLKQRAADAARKYGPHSREFHELIMKLTNEQLMEDATNDDGVVDWDAYYSGEGGSAIDWDAYAKEKKYAAAWQRSEGKNPEGGLNRKGVASYREENPGSKLQMAVTTDPSKLDPDSKAAKRRKSFCARMGGMPGPMQDEKGRPTRKALSLRKWNC